MNPHNIVTSTSLRCQGRTSPAFPVQKSKSSSATPDIPLSKPIDWTDLVEELVCLGIGVHAELGRLAACQHLVENVEVALALGLPTSTAPRVCITIHLFTLALYGHMNDLIIAFSSAPPPPHPRSVSPVSVLSTERTLRIEKNDGRTGRRGPSPGGRS